MGGEGLSALAGCRILVLEDEPIIAVDLQLEAEAAGATVLRMLSQGPAVTLLADGDVDGAVLDYTLPSRKTADPIARELADRGVPFVFYSGDLDQHGERIKMHGAPIIAKPAASRTVLAVLARLIASAKAG